MKKIQYLIGGKEEYFKDSAAYLGTDAVFGEGKYTVVLYFYNYIYNPRYYKFDETTEVFIDGTPWQILKVETDEKRSHIFVYKEYELGPSVHTKHVSTGENVATRTHKAVCDVCGESYKTAINYIKMTATVDIGGIKYGDSVLTKMGDYGFKIVNYPDGIIDFDSFYLNPYDTRYCKYYTDGVYTHRLYLAITDACQDIFYFASDVEGEVNGKNWSLYSKGLLHCGFESPAFTIVKDESIFKFDDRAAAVPEQKKGDAMTPIDLNDCVVGGKSPYTFTKISGPTWLTVTADGTVSGTPDRAGKNENLVLRITDANGKTCEASVVVYVTFVEADLTTLPELKKITIASDVTAPVLGEICKFEYTFTVAERSDIEFYPISGSEAEKLLWLNGTIEQGKEMEAGDRFGVGTYTALICALHFHVGENDFKFAEDLEVSVNGELWGGSRGV